MSSWRLSMRTPLATLRRSRPVGGRALAAAIALWLVATHTRAHADARGGVTAVADGSGREVVERLDAMLPAPTVTSDVAVPGEGDPLDAFSSATTRYVVIVQPEQLIVLDLADRRAVSRTIEPGLVDRAPYAVALVAFELLEIVGAVVPDDALDAAPVITPPDVAPPPRTVTRAPRALVLTLGGVGSLGLDGDVRAFSADVGAQYERAVGRHVLVLGGGARFPGRTRRTYTTSRDVDVRFRYARTDLALRVGMGRDGARFGYRAVLVAGPSRIRVDARTRTSPPARGSDTRASAFVGVAFEARARITDRVALTLGLGLDWLLGATPYGALGELLLDEPRVRVNGSLGVSFRFGV